MAWGSGRIKGSGPITSGHSAHAAGYRKCSGCGEFTRCACPPAKPSKPSRRDIAEQAARDRQADLAAKAARQSRHSSSNKYRAGR